MEYEKISICPPDLQELIEYANSEKKPDDDFNFDFNFGVGLEDLKRQLRYIAENCTDFAQNKYGSGGAAFSKYEMDFTQTLYFRIAEGKITFAANRLVRALQGVDAKRMRICPICQNIFWARRIEAQTCSKRKCSNNFHQRKRRIKDYEKQLSDEKAKLEKLVLNLNPENSLISDQKKKVEKLTNKIKEEKIKNGNL